MHLLHSNRQSLLVAVLDSLFYFLASSACLNPSACVFDAVGRSDGSDVGNVNGEDRCQIASTTLTWFVTVGHDDHVLAPPLLHEMHQQLQATVAAWPANHCGKAQIKQCRCIGGSFRDQQPVIVCRGNRRRNKKSFFAPFDSKFAPLSRAEANAEDSV